MDEQRVGVVVPLKHQDGSLASLAGGALSRRFCAWRGASNRRYVATVYPVDRSDPSIGLPDFQAFVLLAVRRGTTGRRVLDVAVVERQSSRRSALAAGLALGADEWHVHFLAENPAARAAMITDLRARHGGAREALCA